MSAGLYLEESRKINVILVNYDHCLDNSDKKKNLKNFSNLTNILNVLSSGYYFSTYENIKKTFYYYILSAIPEKIYVKYF